MTASRKNPRYSNTKMFQGSYKNVTPTSSPRRRPRSSVPSRKVEDSGPSVGRTAGEPEGGSREHPALTLSLPSQSTPDPSSTREEI